MNIYRFKNIPSTNDFAKAIIEKGENALITADSQSGGRGSKGRSFDSNIGGLYMSKLTFLKNFSAANSFKIMINTSVALVKALGEYNIDARIKWPNDILCGGKKICGILIENTLKGVDILCSIVGIGLNVNNTLNDELLNTATSMQAITGKVYDLAEIEKTILKHLENDYDIDEYEKYMHLIGEAVTVIERDNSFTAIVKGVSGGGQLIADKDGELLNINSGEIKVIKND